MVTKLVYRYFVLKAVLKGIDKWLFPPPLSIRLMNDIIKRLYREPILNVLNQQPLLSFNEQP